MKMDDDIMSAEEFFGEIDDSKSNLPRRRRQRGKSGVGDLFAKMKVKMVMRIYGVSRAKALAIIADRNGDQKATEPANDSSNTDEDNGFMTAEEFFSV